MPAPTALPLVLVPGLMCTADLYAAQIGRFAPGRAVLVADHTRDDSMGAIAERLLAAAPARFALAGLSMGGYVAFEVVRRAPERVARLALLDTSARADLPEQSERRRDAIAIARERGVRLVQKGLLPMLLGPRALADGGINARALAMADATGLDAFVRQQTAIMGRHDSRPFLPQIRCPTLVLVGAEDKLTPPKVAEEMAAGIDGSRLVVVPDAGHLSPMEAPDAVSDALAGWLLL